MSQIDKDTVTFKSEI